MTVGHESPDSPWNGTMRKFGAPGSCILQYPHWTVLLRPKQATLGALVLAAREPAAALPQLSADALAELREVSAAMEQALHEAFRFDKINYLMLMMVDPDVHFHVLPRYDGERRFDGQAFTDPGWPGPPDLAHVNETDDGLCQRLIEQIQTRWP